VAPEKRGRWLFALTAVLFALFLFVPPGWRLFVPLFGAPLFLAVSFERLSYDEINRLDVLLNDKFGGIPSWINRVLFEPWAVSITNAAAEDAQPWARELQKMYMCWIRRQRREFGRRGLRVVFDNRRRPYRHRIVISGPRDRWYRLLAESGQHRWSFGAVEKVARVDVRPLSVPAQASMDADIESFDDAVGAAVPGTAIVREYECAPAIDTGLGRAYVAVYDRRTGVFAANPDKVLLGDIDQFLDGLLAAQVQQPINADGSSVFTANRGVVPVKFALTSNGAPTGDLPPATIVVNRTSGAAGVVDESVYADSADDGSTFRVGGCQYLYNLDANALGAGKYRVDVVIHGLVAGSAAFELK
jgi:hypothetical protein